MSLKVGSLFVSVGANISGFSKGMEAVAKDVAKTSKQIKAISGEIANVANTFSAVFAGAVAVASKSNKEVAEHVARAKAAFSALANEVATAVLPTVQKVADVLEALGQRFSSLSPQQRDFIAKFAEIAAVVGIASLALSKVAGVTATVAGAVAMLSKSFRVGLLGPVLLGAVAVAALVLAAGALYKAWKANLGGIQDVARDVWETISGYVTNFLSVVGRVFKKAKDVIFDALRMIADGWRQLMKLIGSNAGEDFFANIGKGIDLTDEFFTPEGLKKLFGTAIETGKGIGDGVLYGLRESWAGAKDLFKDLGFGDLLGGFDGTGPKKAPAKGGGAPPAPTKKGGPFLSYAQIGRLDFQAAKGSLALLKESERYWSTINQTLRQAGGMLKDAILTGAGNFGRVVESAMQGFTTGGPGGAVIAASIELLAQSKQFQHLMKGVSAIVQMVADTVGLLVAPFLNILAAVQGIVQGALGVLAPMFSLLGTLLEPLVPPLMIVGKILGALAPVFAIFQAALLAIQAPLLLIAGPILRGLFWVLQQVGWIVLKLIAPIADFWNFVVNTIRNVLYTLSDIEIAGAKPLTFLKKMANSMSFWLVDVQAMHDAAAALVNTSWEEIEAEAAATVKTWDLVDATKAAVEAMTNIPSGLKIAFRRFQAIQAEGASGSNPFTPSTTHGAYSGSNPFSPGMTKKNASGTFNPSAQSSGGGDIHITINGATDAKAVAAEVIRILQRKRYAQSGGAFVWGG